MTGRRPPWPYVIGAIMLIAIAGIAVPAWADRESPDADEPFAIPAPPPGPDGPMGAGLSVVASPEHREELEEFVDCMRANGADVPGVRFGRDGEGITINAADEEALAEAEEACGPPPAPPPPPKLSEAEIEAHRDALADCVREREED
jgi:cell division septation protein DedD